MKLRALPILCLVFAAVSAVAQMGGPPGPEVKKLDYFVGTWTSEGTIAQGPWGMGGGMAPAGTDLSRDPTGCGPWPCGSAATARTGGGYPGGIPGGVKP